MKIIVNRSKATRRLADKTELRMGANEVSDEVAERALNTPYFVALCKRGIFKVENPPDVVPEIVHEPGDYVPDLRLLKVVEALKAVKECADIAQLDVWLHQDGRKRVKEAILARGIEITDKLPKAADPDDADGDTDGDTSDLGIPIVGGR